MEKNYIRHILDLFTRHTYSEATNKQVQQWLADEEHAAQKQEELQRIWVRAGEEASAKGLEDSLATLQRRTGMRQLNVHQRKENSQNLNQSKEEIQNLNQRNEDSHGFKLLGKSAASSRSILPLYLWRAAAVLFFAVSAISLYWAVSSQQVNTVDILQCHIPKAEMKEFDLPDGTHVILNAKSTLLYPESFDGNTRSVYLVGEGFFKVSPNKEKPFIVKANDFQVTALGTEFNVHAYPENKELKAMLVEGSIKVEFDGLSSNVILKPNEQLVYNTHTKKALVTEESAEDVTAWTDGSLIFKNMSLNDILMQLERKLPYTFVYSPKKMGDGTYSFRFKKDASLKEIMLIISRVVGNMHYEIRKDECYIIHR